MKLKKTAANTKTTTYILTGFVLILFYIVILNQAGVVVETIKIESTLCVLQNGNGTMSVFIFD